MEPVEVPVLDIAPDQAKHEAKQWLGSYRHIRTRCQAVAAELGQGPGCEALRGKELSDAAHAASTTALQRLEKEVWTQVKQARKVVGAVTATLSAAQPGRPPPVEELAAAIDAADRVIGDVRDQQCAALEALYQEEAQLEAEIEAIGSRIDEELLQEQEQAEARQRMMLMTGPAAAAAAARMADGPAGPSTAARSRPLSAGHRRPPSRSRERRMSGAGVGSGSGRGGSGGGGGGSILAGAGGGGGGGSGLAPEVEEYNDFVAKHGPTGGWDAEDHEEFLAVLHSCGGDYTHAVAIVLERAVGYSRKEVMDHARWHMDLVDLDARRRAALERWRAAKQQQRAALAAQEAALFSDTSKQAQRERQRDQRQQLEEVLVGEAKKAMVARWKAEREEQQREAAEAARARAAAAAAAKQAEVEARQAANKLRLQMVKEAKARQRRDAERRAAAEAAIRAALTEPTPQQRQRVAERSAATFQRRQSLLASQEAARGQRERVQAQLLEKVHVEAAPDPGRLLKGTAAHMQRVEAARGEERKAKDSGFILHSARRITPGWRAGLTGA
ncbi:hypothetical protein HYH02_006502 [Chlamydomonas schloesseri]|uniref:Uncharacterized protein n=1 Tax=Chlamydomonas schloesseri TaxID=2026947 RepID=A0A836B674_9CHLO|nr:hypothetical protein HYH02_006502 [Chlamydomonas schloesseri]|eukprot:KAG2448613.1 hypothetical protein HYH02_006502 [Chlamydomonas schloesseri]